MLAGRRSPRIRENLSTSCLRETYPFEDQFPLTREKEFERIVRVEGELSSGERRGKELPIWAVRLAFWSKESSKTLTKLPVTSNRSVVAA
jgi:hypothetical protein